MTKLPVGQTVRFAYAFAFGDIGTVIGLIWIPALINAVANFFASRIYIPALTASLDSAQPPPAAALALFLGVSVLSLLLTSMIGVAVTRQALGLRQGPALAHFSLGLTELRVFAAFIGLYLLLALFILFFMIVVANVAAAGLTIAKGNAAAMALVTTLVPALILAGLCALIYAAVRLTFFLLPSATEGGGFGLARGWRLAKGNFWPIVGVGLLTVLPVLFVVNIATSVILGPQSNPGAPPADVAAMLRQIAQEMREMEPHMPVLMGVNFVISPLMYGLLFAPAAFAYRVLSGKALIESGEME